jgi:hypothetical protein
MFQGFYGDRSAGTSASELLADKQTPSHGGYSSAFVQERLKEMEALLPKKQAKKSVKK